MENIQSLLIALENEGRQYDENINKMVNLVRNVCKTITRFVPSGTEIVVDDDSGYTLTVDEIKAYNRSIKCVFHRDGNDYYVFPVYAERNYKLGEFVAKREESINEYTARLDDYRIFINNADKILNRFIEEVKKVNSELIGLEIQMKNALKSLM